MNSSVQAAHSDMAMLNLFMCVFDLLQKFHHLPDCRFGPLLVMNVLACVVKEVEFFKEVDMGDPFPDQG